MCLWCLKVSRNKTKAQASNEFKKRLKKKIKQVQVQNQK